MNDAWHLAKIKGFEQVLAAPDIALLRVIAKPPRRRSSAGPRPTLLADDGHVVNRYAPLPSPVDPKGVLRAAYAVPEAFVTPETVFSLELDDGAVLSLPAPTAGVPRSAPPDRPAVLDAAPAVDVKAVEPDVNEPVDDATKIENLAAAESEEWVKPPHPAGERRSDLMASIVELSADVARYEREASEQRVAREAIEAALQTSREEAERSVRDAEAEIERLQALEQATRSELGSRITEAQASAHAAESRAEQAVAREQEALAEAATARDAFTGFERRIAGLEISLREHGDQIAVLEAELAEAVRLRDELAHEASRLRTERTRLERELNDALDSVRRMAIERDELARQAAAFDQVAIKARQRATEFETAHQQSQATLNELETWRGELERRLSSMSSELGEARARLSDNDRELTRLRGELAEAEARAELAHAQIIALSDAAVGNDAGTTVIDRAALDRMAGELATLRADSETAGQRLDAATSMRIGEVEAEREELAQRVAQLTGMLEQAELRHPAQEQPGLAALSARAEAQAEEIAARELAQAAADQAP